ncbi:cation:proton antiporter [Fodinibacter luteus]|uniref:Cation:proton antiporter n=1 Tax=Fodinibacter luteus TaxID=552064 RepID=A0ABP8KCE1_9MICO
MTLAATYLVAALAGGSLARWLRLPPLVGFLSAGFALAALGVEKHPVVDTLGELGVTLLLFAVGLSLDVRLLLRREVWLTATAHLVLMVGAGFVVLAGLAAVGVGGLTGLPASTLTLLAFALAFSSTVLVVKVLEERSESRSRYGRIAIGILVVQDLAVVAFIAVSGTSRPSPWALALVLLWPARRLLAAVWERLGHGELQVLFGVVVALVPGYLLFEAVGLEGQLGAVVMGLLLAPHPRSGDLVKSLFSVKELLLVAFFLSIGLNGVPTPGQVATGLLLLLLLPAQTALYLVLLSALGVRRRTSALTAAALANDSEFALVVAATAASAGLLEPGWVTTMSVAVAASFLVSTAVNLRAERWADAVERRWPDRDPARLDPAERPIPLHDVDALVLGLGRVGTAAYTRLAEEGLRVLGIEHDEQRVAQLSAQGVEAVAADATDSALWRRLVAVRSLHTVVLAMPFHHANLGALAVVRARHFTGTVAAVARYDDEVTDLLAHGADTVLHIYSGSGLALAEAALGDPATLRALEEPPVRPDRPPPSVGRRGDEP